MTGASACVYMLLVYRWSLTPHLLLSQTINLSTCLCSFALYVNVSWLDRRWVHISFSSTYGPKDNYWTWFLLYPLSLPLLPLSLLPLSLLPLLMQTSSDRMDLRGVSIYGSASLWQILWSMIWRWKEILIFNHFLKIILRVMNKVLYSTHVKLF